MYYLFRQLSTTTVQRGECSYEEALEQVNKRFHFIMDEEGNRYNNKEELENAKDIGSDDRAWEDFITAGGTEISEDADRELSESDSDRTEPSSERDN